MDRRNIYYLYFICCLDQRRDLHFTSFAC